MLSLCSVLPIFLKGCLSLYEILVCLNWLIVCTEHSVLLSKFYGAVQIVLDLLVSEVSSESEIMFFFNNPFTIL